MPQHIPCYSAVSASLTKPIPDCSNYSPFCHTNYLILWINTSLVLQARPFTKPLRWSLETNTSLLQRFTAESSRELMSLEKYRSALRKLNSKQRQVVCSSSSSSNCHLNSVCFSSLSSLCSLSQSSLFSLSPSLSTITSFSSDQFSVILS